MATTSVRLTPRGADCPTCGAPFVVLNGMHTVLAPGLWNTSRAEDGMRRYAFSAHALRRALGRHGDPADISMTTHLPGRVRLPIRVDCRCGERCLVT